MTKSFDDTNNPDSVYHPTSPQPRFVSELRIGRKEREKVANLLAEAYAEERIDDGEYQIRLQLALEAKTQTQLDELIVDLTHQLKKPAPLPVTYTANLVTANNATPTKQGSTQNSSVETLTKKATYIPAEKTDTRNDVNKSNTGPATIAVLIILVIVIPSLMGFGFMRFVDSYLWKRYDVTENTATQMEQISKFIAETSVEQGEPLITKVGSGENFSIVQTSGGQPMPISSQIAARTVLESIKSPYKGSFPYFRYWTIEGTSNNQLVMTSNKTSSTSRSVTCTIDLNVPLGTTPQGKCEKIQQQ